MKPSNLKYLINENGWNSYEFKRTDLMSGAEFAGSKPYLIFSHYGSGFKFYENGTCKINYSDGTKPIPDNSLEVKWESVDENTIKIDVDFDEDFEFEIIEISETDLWIKYEYKDIFFEYKLKAIE